MALIAGLNNSAVHRLKHTSENVHKKTTQTLEALVAAMHSQKSYAAYRELLHTCNPPLVPYLGVYLTDLTFIDDGNQDKTAGLINFK